jgi:hypothetical protein
VAKANIATKTKTRERFGRFRAVLRSIAVIVSYLVICGQTFPQEFRPPDSRVEASDLYNFGKFVIWPTDRRATAETFQICILGKDPFGETLDAIVSGESIRGKRIEVKQLKGVQQADTCMILFVSSSEESRLPRILVAAGNFSVLTVSDVKQFAERGGDIGLVHQQNSIRFEVNRTAAEQCHLVVSSELLKVAVKVIRER